MPYSGDTHSNNNQKNHKIYNSIVRRICVLAATILISVASLFSVNLVSAQSLQLQIKNLNKRNQAVKSSINNLDMEAGNFQEAITTLQAQIDALIASITANQQMRDQLSEQISAKTAELEVQKSLLGDSIRALYLEEDMSTLEMVVTSKDLSDYLDKQQYRVSFQNKINTAVEEIKTIQAQLELQKAEKEALIAQQQVMQSQLNTQQAEQSRLLSLNQAQQNELSSQMQQNNSRIAQLRQLQAAENARLMRAGGGRTINVPDTTGYPWASVQPFPNSYPDPWGMYKRQCVSYTAWKVYKDGKQMPYWGGRGNAKNWANNARTDGIPVYSSPQRGDIAVSTRGTYGHVMYVEEILGNGMIRISQYNAGWTGTYSEAIISPSGLEFVRFRTR
jgi:surface antigen